MEIEQYTFGKIVIDGESYTDDLKIAGGRILPGWFRKSGHRVEPEDAADMLAEEPEVLILGKGEPGRMSASPALVELLRQKQIKLIEKPTKEAASLFNELHSQGKNVAAGFHLTC
ncbi:MAG TPA: MTH938/NDUFAF3 family protein [Desulfosalsimonadaceae bacterium]|nr:MTH938/NDUFAF3 family protein [Desulfosalsimonadaceae bacterium]